MSRHAFVNSGSLKFVQNISVDPRVFQADEIKQKQNGLEYLIRLRATVPTSPSFFSSIVL